MGRHSAAAGAGTDPIVAAALGRRSGVPAEHEPAGRPVASEGPLGWPGPEPAPGGGGLGWPGRGGEAPVSDRPVGRARPVRRGWRRLLGLDPAA